MWHEAFSTDRPEFGGSGALNEGALRTQKAPLHGLDQSLSLTIPPLGAAFFVYDEAASRQAAQGVRPVTQAGE